MKYRKEIDGLRAVAVIPVLLFHAGFELFSGGFVGVDVFFVISGYLITTLIWNEMQEERFSLVNFYERRARRILPALFFVIIVCLPFAFWLMFPYQLVDFSKSIISVNLFISNVFFWSQGGYFGGPNETFPLLHTWSLAVEEQYYMFFPLVLMFVWKKLSHRLIIGLIVFTTIVSLGFAEVGSHLHPTSNFYLIPSRAWELLAGSLVAIYLVKHEQPSGSMNQIGSLAGLLLILAAIFVFDDSTPFPGLWALIPVMGTVLIVLYCRPKTWVYMVLSQPAVVAVGLTSYSIYLWHQPILAFARIQYDELSNIVLIILLLASCVMGWFSWRFVERPFRNRQKLTRKHIFGFSLVMSLSLSLFAGWIVYKDGLVNRYPAYQHQLVATSPIEHGRYVTGSYSKVYAKPFVTDKKKLLVIGDSFSQDFYNMILETGSFSDYEVSAVLISAKCQIYYGVGDVSQNIKPRDSVFCEGNKIDEDIVAKAKTADVVVFVASWLEWSAQILPETISNFNFDENQKIIIVGTKGFGEVFAKDLIDIPQDKLTEAKAKILPERVLTNDVMVENLKDYEFLNIIEILCDEDSLCPQFTAESELIFHDGSHLTRAGAKYLGKLIFETPLLLPYARL